MIVALDVDYNTDRVVAAGIGFDAWTEAVPSLELVVASDAPAAEYEPGRFYLRELPHLTAVLALVDPAPAIIVVDGYVWLAPGRPGLGAHLHEACGVPVIGVAKNPFAGAVAIEVVRGDNARPLLVTAVGIEPADAAAHIRTMHGPHRIPTLLRRVDQLARAQ